MLSIESIRNEIQKFLKNDFIKNEIHKIKGEIKSLEFYKKLPEPTQKHLNQLESNFQSLSKKITKTQKQVDQEFSSALKSLHKRKDEAAVRIQDLRQFAFDQKDVLEEAVLARLQSVTAGTKKKKTRKKAAKKATSKKKATKKASSKKKVVKKSAAQKSPAKKAAKKSPAKARKKATKS